MSKNPTNPSIDSENIRALAKLLDETGLSEIEYEAGGVRLRVARQLVASGHFAAAPMAHNGNGAALTAGDGTKIDASHPGAVTSPMVGVTYLSPEPGSAAFVKVGDVVTEGQTLLLIEAMKTFNPIRAPRGGKVVQIIASDGHPVEFGELLMILD
jgi:acetyl-CoA carboxylase biotin carboxyl carrier protein